MTVNATNVAGSSLNEWTSGASYTMGEQVKVTAGVPIPHRAYEASQDHTADSENKPVKDGNAFWIDLGPINANAMFDGMVPQSTIAELNQDIEVDVTIPGVARWLYLFGLRDISTARVTEYDGATQAKQKDYPLLIASPWDTESGAYTTKRSVALPLLGISGQRVVLTLTSTGYAEVAHMLVGVGYSMGYTDWGAEPGLKDFSVFEQNEFGTPSFVSRRVTRQMLGTVWVETDNFDRIYTLFESHMNRLCVFDFNNDDHIEESFDSLMLYGKLESVNVGLDYGQTPLNIKIMGL
jgi:hypothetical protein